MKTRLRIIIGFIICSLRLGVMPWRYFQLNANYFSRQKKIFSKIYINTLIPKKWRLHQEKFNSKKIPNHFPVFLKPDWAQNSFGVQKIDHTEQFKKLPLRPSKYVDYLIQTPALGKREFEVLLLQSQNRFEKDYLMSITETCNKKKDALPINGICNNNTFYVDQTNDFSVSEKNSIRKMLNTIAHFSIARFAISCHSKKDLLEEKFHIIEINLFIPMPLCLLDQNIASSVHAEFIGNLCRKLAKITKSIPKEQKAKSIFFPIVFKHYQLKYENH